MSKQTERYARQIRNGQIPPDQRGTLVGTKVLPIIPERCGRRSIQNTAKIAMSTTYGKTQYNATFWQSALLAVRDTGKCPESQREFMKASEWVVWNKSSRRWDLTAKGLNEL